jgi:hypothetical protein
MIVFSAKPLLGAGLFPAVNDYRIEKGRPFFLTLDSLPRYGAVTRGALASPLLRQSTYIPPVNFFPLSGLTATGRTGFALVCKHRIYLLPMSNNYLFK